MDRAAHVYQIFIAATPDQVWTAITDSAWTRRYFHATTFTEPPAVGRPYRKVLPDGQPASEGMVEEMTPPVDGRAGRFVHTWHVLYDAEMAAEPAGRVEWQVQAAGEGVDPGPAGAQRAGAEPAHLGQRQGRLGLGARRTEDRAGDRVVAAPGDAGLGNPPPNPPGVMGR